MYQPQAMHTTAGGGYLWRLMQAVTRYSSADREELLAFRRAMYGPEAAVSRPEYFHWLGAESAAPGAPLYWVYRKDGRIAGQQGAVPVRLKIGTESRRALWALDLMVVPELQLRGVGPALNEKAFRETGLLLGLDVTDSARGALLHAGWMDLGTVPFYVRPLDAVAVLSQRRPKLRSLGGGATAFFKLLRWVGTRTASASGLGLEEVEAFDERLDGLWEQVSPSYPVICQRDRRMLEWRFGRYPSKDRYRLFHLLRRGSVIGYAVLRVGDHRGLRAGFLVDYLCAPRWTAGLVSLCVEELARLEVTAVYLLSSSASAALPLRALGFLPRESGWRLMMRVDGLSTQASRLVQDPGNWFITLADADVDRPREGVVYPAEMDSPWRRGTPIG